jgi:4,5-DOPA dioxygenase extradiol
MNNSERMPSLFIGHGSPMNVVEKNPFTEFLSSLSTQLPRPKSILVISAHWETQGVRVLNVEKPRTIHDFGGFPKELYQIQYAAKGAPELAERIIELSTNNKIQSDSTWGLDHGAWTILKHLYPMADIPVLQLSLNSDFKFEDHLNLARELRPLRDEGVLILGSGNVTHNLRRISWDESLPASDWAVEFDQMIKDALLTRNESILLNQDAKYFGLWNMAHPSVEHYLPLIYVFGCSYGPERVKFLFEGMQLGSLSMRSFLF